MSAIHFKFRSMNDYEVVTFDGPSVSLKELRELIISKKRMSKAKDFKLEISNESTKHIYDDENIQIPKNSTVIIRRLPLDYVKPSVPKDIKEQLTVEQLSRVGNLATADASEESKIQAMMIQSKMDSVFAASMPEKLKTPICFHCKAQGHVIRSCPLLGNQNDSKISGTEPAHVFLRATLGLPLSEDDHKEAVGGAQVALNSDVPVPEYLLCPICNQLLEDAVLIPCCGMTFCQKCITNYLEKNQFTCPNCKKTSSGADVIENKSIRKSVHALQSARSSLNHATEVINDGLTPVMTNSTSSRETVSNSSTSMGDPSSIKTGKDETAAPSTKSNESAGDNKLAEPAESHKINQMGAPVPSNTVPVNNQMGFVMNPFMGMLLNPFAAMAMAASAATYGGMMNLSANQPHHHNLMTGVPSAHPVAVKSVGLTSTSGGGSSADFSNAAKPAQQPQLQSILRSELLLQKEDFYLLQSGLNNRLKELKHLSSNERYKNSHESTRKPHYNSYHFKHGSSSRDVLKSRTSYHSLADKYDKTCNSLKDNYKNNSIRSSDTHRHQKKVERRRSESVDGDSTSSIKESKERHKTMNDHENLHLNKSKYDTTREVVKIFTDKQTNSVSPMSLDGDVRSSEKSTQGKQMTKPSKYEKDRKCRFRSKSLCSCSCSERSCSPESPDFRNSKNTKSISKRKHSQSPIKDLNKKKRRRSSSLERDVSVKNNSLRSVNAHSKDIKFLYKK